MEHLTDDEFHALPVDWAKVKDKTVHWLKLNISEREERLALEDMAVVSQARKDAQRRLDEIKHEELQRKLKALEDAEYRVMVSKYVKELRKVGPKDRFWFITINPQKGIDLDIFLKAVNKCISKKWITKYAYTIEQSETKQFYEDRIAVGSSDVRFHLHLIILDKYKPSHVQREIRNTFKSFVGNADQNSLINIQQKPAEYLQDKIDYIKGKKTGEGKSDKVIGDNIFRTLFGLKPYYSNFM